MCIPLDQKVGAAIYISDITDGSLANSLQGRVPALQLRGVAYGYGVAEKIIMLPRSSL